MDLILPLPTGVFIAETFSALQIPLFRGRPLTGFEKFLHRLPGLRERRALLRLERLPCEVAYTTSQPITPGRQRPIKDIPSISA